VLDWRTPEQNTNLDYIQDGLLYPCAHNAKDFAALASHQSGRTGGDAVAASTRNGFRPTNDEICDLRFASACNTFPQLMNCEGLQQRDNRQPYSPYETLDP
jgi:hypothetical protein